MDEDPKLEGKKFAEFLRTMPSGLRLEGSRREIEEAKADHTEFKEAFRAGRCSMCGGTLADFERTQPCLHGSVLT